MGYGRKRYRSWRSRGWANGPSKFTVLNRLFGDAVGEIRRAFLTLDADALDELFADYGAVHGESAERYARRTFPNWKSRKTALSGQTMERLVELVPPYLLPEQRFSILQYVLKRHRQSAPSRVVRIDVKNPDPGFAELRSILGTMRHEDVLAHLPEHVMKAAKWLYDDDVTAARAMLAEIERKENDLIRATASREIELLKTAISTGKVQSANYSVDLPSGKLYVTAFAASKCFVSTVCFGEAAIETAILRNWRDNYLSAKTWGRDFIAWYYKNGERWATRISRSRLLTRIFRFGVGIFAHALARRVTGESNE